MEYRPRTIDNELTEAVTYAGGVLIEGVRGCGKTRTAREQAASWVAVDSDDAGVRIALEQAPALLLEGETPRLIDEWQLAPSLWNSARRRIDDSDSKGLFIFTGSSTPPQDPNRHSGAHRFTTLRMRPMTLFERGIGDGAVSLAALLTANPEAAAFEPTLRSPSLSDTLDAIAHGGWPADLATSTAHALKFIQEYLDHVVSFDLNRVVEDVQRDPDRMRLLLSSLARNLATEVNYSTIAADIARSRDISRNTVSQYVSALERLFVVERQSAWTGKVRSKSAIRTTEKLHFADPAMACALLGVDAGGLLKDLNTAGFVFESAVFHHLSVFSQPLRGRVAHYRDKAGREADMIISLPDGRWGVCEVKLGQAAIPNAVESLDRFVANIDTSAIGEPAFKAIITANGPCLKLESGHYTFNLQALKP